MGALLNLKWTNVAVPLKCILVSCYLRLSPGISTCNSSNQTQSLSKRLALEIQGIKCVSMQYLCIVTDINMSILGTSKD